MNIDEFWALIEPGKDDETPEESLRLRLEALDPNELPVFQKHFDELFGRAHRWDLWGAAYLIEGGCSDDGFIDFRYALISKGRSVYEEALRAPDSLADVDIISNESFGYVAREVYEDKLGQALPDGPRVHPIEPVGEEWDFEDDDQCQKRLPKISARFAA
jgi:hypothetical protein